MKLKCTVKDVDQKYLKKFSQFFEKNKTNKELTDSTLLKINQNIFCKP